VIVSDGSNDRTNEIVQQYDDSRLKFIAYPDRGGKAKALNTGIQYITGDVVVLTDANVVFQPDAIRKLVGVLNDDSLGCAVGNVVLRSDNGNIAPESLYSRYEEAIHKAEANWQTMITVDGAMYALRREYMTPIPPDSLADDWYLASGVLGNHKHIAYVPEAVGFEYAAETVSGEFTRKVRMVAGGYQTAFRRSRLFFNPILFPRVVFMFISHKLLRWLAGILMAVFYLANLTTLNTLWFQVTFAAQTSFYTLALGGWLFGGIRKPAILHIPYYFVAVNLAAILGLWKYLTGGQKVTWERGRR